MKNCMLMIAGRRVNQWVRRMFIQLLNWIRWEPLWLKRLRSKRIGLACKHTLTEDERDRLREIGWKLGQGSVYKMTREERAEQSRIASEILVEMGL